VGRVVLALVDVVDVDDEGEMVQCASNVHVFIPSPRSSPTFHSVSIGPSYEHGCLIHPSSGLQPYSSKEHDSKKSTVLVCSAIPTTTFLGRRMSFGGSHMQRERGREGESQDRQIPRGWPGLGDPHF
jgi:hypothetical protein